MKTTVVKKASDGSFYVELDDELLAQAGLENGDTVKWETIPGTNSASFKKVKSEEFEWVLVDAISQFRQRYCVQVPKGKTEWALDTVTMEEAKEFSQEHLGETIFSHRVVSEEEALKVFDQDNGYLAGWDKETKMRSGFTFARDYDESYTTITSVSDINNFDSMYSINEEAAANVSITFPAEDITHSPFYWETERNK